MWALAGFCTVVFCGSSESMGYFLRKKAFQNPTFQDPFSLMTHNISFLCLCGLLAS